MASPTPPVGASQGDERPAALLVGVQLPGVSADELQASLDELQRLVKTLGLRVVGRMTQARPNEGSSTVLGAGKVVELAQRTGGRGVVPASAHRRRKGATPKEPTEDDRQADVVDGDEVEPTADEVEAKIVVFDQELTPTQIRNLEGALSAEVLDRSAVILGIFQRHARTREARLQVEIARLTYLAPRLRASGGGGDRQRGGVGGKGAGESSLELDRRRARDRIAELRAEMATVRRESDTRRARRDQRSTVALVGYTNAGKSSLMRALTGSEVLVRNQLFATLDTTIRVLHPPTRPPIFVSDTVGFIKKLPHDLVASFRSTLQEAQEASLLVYVVDASDPAWASQLEVTRGVLDEVGASDVPSLLLLNKADRLGASTLTELRSEHPDAAVMSAKRPEDVAALHQRLVRFFERGMVEEDFFVGFAQTRWVHTIHEAAEVVSEHHDEEGTHLRVRAAPPVLAALRARLSDATS